MKLLSLLALLAVAVADCQLSSDGNYYCAKTNKIYYDNIGFSGTYNQVTSMDSNSGACSSQPQAFGGDLAPLDELSVHFRGPLKLLQFGVYQLNNNDKREVAEEADCQPRHVHHKHKRVIEYVTETIVVDGQAQPTTLATQVIDNPLDDNVNKAYRSDISTKSAPTTTSTGTSTPSNAPVNNGDWVRSAYFTPNNAQGLTFLNHYGGSHGSGVWDSTFGNSLSFCNSDASGGAASPQVLGDFTLPSNNEYVIFSDQECNGDCAYVRPGSPAYRGFSGPDKIFVFEFEMPSDGSKGFNADMPAIWLLNAQIPRTLQYGNAACSCWSTGCGELDLFEILSPGSNKLISHLHTGQGVPAGSNYGGGGSQDWFERPTSGSLKAAVVLTGNQIHVLEVSDSFDSVLSSQTVQNWISQPGSHAAVGY